MIDNDFLNYFGQFAPYTRKNEEARLSTSKKGCAWIRQPRQIWLPYPNGSQKRRFRRLGIIILIRVSFPKKSLSLKYDFLWKFFYAFEKFIVSLVQIRLFHIWEFRKIKKLIVDVSTTSISGAHCAENCEWVCFSTFPR